MRHQLLCLVLFPMLLFGQRASDPSVGPRPWTVPSGLAEFGSRTKDSIRVAVFGYSVTRPGYYYLHKGVAVQDAALAAKTRDFIGWEHPFSGIQRRKPDGSTETIWFTRGRREVEEKIALRDGDVLRLSHEVY